MVYITTSRKPSQITRRLTRFLAIALGGMKENRGKRSVQEIIERAQAKGHYRCLLIYEHKGNPSKLCFLEEGKWLPAICLTSIVESLREPSRRLPGLSKITATGSLAKKMAQLFEKNDELLQGLELRITDTQITFWLDGSQTGPVLRIAGLEEPIEEDEEEKTQTKASDAQNEKQGESIEDDEGKEEE